jgi:hypothetical protein
MGGPIQIVFRKEDGTVRTPICWTNPWPHNIHCMQFLNKDQKFMNECIGNSDEQWKAEGGSVGGVYPNESYGIIVIDWKLNKILSCNDYSNSWGHMGSYYFTNAEAYNSEHVDDMNKLIANQRLVCAERYSPKTKSFSDGPSVEGKSLKQIAQMLEELEKKKMFYVKVDMKPFECICFDKSPEGFAAIKEMMKKDGFAIKDEEWASFVGSEKTEAK